MAYNEIVQESNEVICALSKIEDSSVTIVTEIAESKQVILHTIMSFAVDLVQP